jgi:glucose/arabinose dehydrogenase
MNKKFVLLYSVIIVMITSCAQAQDDKAVHHSQQADFKRVTIAEGLHHPWSLAFLPDGHFLVSERRGRLWHISQQGEKKEITGLPELYSQGQGGLLDLALGSDFENDGWLYFSYAAAKDSDYNLANTEVARAKVDFQQYRLTDLEVIFRAIPKVKGDNHWGSRLQFGAGGLLYITLGERYDYSEEAQNPYNHLGAVVRISPSGKVPESNPFKNGGGGQPEVYTYGHRNVQGVALHPYTGEIWIAEHGPMGGDEVNILKPGANYGWPKVTFGLDYSGAVISDKTSAPGIEGPLLQWTPSIAPSGMAFYAADKFPQWQGDLFVGALALKHLRRVELDGKTVVAQEELLKDWGQRIRDVRQGPDGYLYLLTDESDGQLVRLEPL